MIYVISDLHGYPFERFLELLEKAAFSAEDTLYVLGDVIDRGDDGVRYLLWMQQQKNAVLIMGNHEDMMLKCDFLFKPTAKELMGKLDYEQRVNLAVWMSNGAEPTVRGLFELGYEQRKAIYDYSPKRRCIWRSPQAARNMFLSTADFVIFAHPRSLTGIPTSICCGTVLR